MAKSRKSKITLLSLIAIIIIISFAFLETKLVIFKNIHQTINKSIEFEVSDYIVTIPLHSGAYIQSYEIGEKPHIKYFTFKNSKEINAYFNDVIEDANKQDFILNESSTEEYLYYNKDTDKYVLVPTIYEIDDTNKFISKVFIRLPSAKEIELMIKSLNEKLN